MTARIALKSLCLILAMGLSLEGMPAIAAAADQTATNGQPKKPVKMKTVCTVSQDGKKICKKVASADPQVAKSSGFFQSVGAPLVVGGAGISAAALNGKNCGRGNNANGGNGQNNGNCANSP